MYNVYVDGTLLPDADIIALPEPAQEKIQFNFSTLISAKQNITLNNINAAKNRYDDEVESSIFYGSSWYNKNIQIIDTTLDLTIWNGRIKNVKKTDGKGQITLETTNYIKDIIDSDCVVSMGGSTDATPAEVILYILKTVAKIPASAINQASFDRAYAIQAAAGGFIVVNYTQEQNTKSSEVINEILRITSSSLYTVNNIIYYSAGAIYTGALNYELTEADILQGSYSTEYSTDNIYNSYSIAYKSSTAIAYANPTSTPAYLAYSREQYGYKYFNVPNEDVGSTASADFKILCKTEAAAHYYGDLAITLNHQVKKVVKMELRKSVSSQVYLNRFIDLTYKTLTKEPIRITERQIRKNKMTVTAEMLNFPYEVIVRDKIKPDPVTLVSVKPTANNKILVTWTASQDAGLYGYYVEFTTSPANYAGTYSAQGFSPVLVADPVMKRGYCTLELSDFFESAKYYFRVRVLDNARNISNPSNMLALDIHYLTVPEVEPTFYHCTGDLLTGLSFLDGVGTAPAGYSTYDDFNYDAGQYGYAAVYTSPILSCQGGFNNITLRSSTSGGYYRVYYRTYNSGTYGEWIEFTGALEEGYYCYTATDLNSSFIQIKVVFDIPYLYPSYSIAIYTINEAE